MLCSVTGDLELIVDNRGSRAHPGAVHGASPPYLGLCLFRGVQLLLLLPQPLQPRQDTGFIVLLRETLPEIGLASQKVPVKAEEIHEIIRLPERASRISPIGLLTCIVQEGRHLTKQHGGSIGFSLPAEWSPSLPPKHPRCSLENASLTVNLVDDEVGREAIYPRPAQHKILSGRERPEALAGRVVVGPPKRLHGDTSKLLLVHDVPGVEVVEVQHFLGWLLSQLLVQLLGGLGCVLVPRTSGPALHAGA